MHRPGRNGSDHPSGNCLTPSDEENADGRCSKDLWSLSESTTDIQMPPWICTMRIIAASRVYLSFVVEFPPREFSAWQTYLKCRGCNWFSPVMCRNNWLYIDWQARNVDEKRLNEKLATQYLLYQNWESHSAYYLELQSLTNSKSIKCRKMPIKIQSRM